MILLSDGLKAFAGDSLRTALLRFTGKPVTAFVSGATVTAMVQSSSATTLATIGFVSAGLITFPQSIGILFGASLGTTSTGWLVSTLGLKFSIGLLALPLTGLGAFLRLLGRGKASSLGLALAGFGLIFIGIDTLQAGMAELSTVFDLGRLAYEGLLGHLLLMAVGVAMTVIMQSSSAAVATTLAALHAGAINFEQAAALVIGQAVGTTVTAALAMIGATTAAKRTALAHIVFNATTGVVAVVLLPLFMWLFTWTEARFDQTPGAVSLAAFHTSFIALGVVLFLPFSGAFARLIERILPDRGPAFTRHLDSSLHTMPSVALEAVRNALREILVAECQHLKGLVQSAPAPVVGANDELVRALEQTGRFLGQVPLASGEEETGVDRVSLFHALDHLTRLVQLQPPPDLVKASENPALKDVFASYGRAVAAAEAFGGPSHEEPISLRDAGKVAGVWQDLSGLRRGERVRLLEQTAAGESDPDATLRTLDQIRYADTVVYHLFRITSHLAGRQPAGEPSG